MFVADAASRAFHIISRYHHTTKEINFMTQRKVQLQFALRDDKIISVHELSPSEKGLACHCICPSCKTELLAKLGTQKQWHFAHKTIDCDITTAQQTALHLIAKEIIEESKKIKLPAVQIPPMDLPEFGTEYTCEYCDELGKDGRCTVKNTPETKDTCAFCAEFGIFTPELFHDACGIPVTSVTLETRISDIIPDVIIKTRGQELLVEIAVTHFIDATKREKLIAKQLPTIEIDLKSLLHQKIDRESLRRIIINGTAYKRWAYHPTAFPKAAKQYKVAYDKAKTEYLRNHPKIPSNPRLTSEERTRRFKEREYWISVSNPILRRYKKTFLDARIESLKDKDFTTNKGVFDAHGDRWYECSDCNTLHPYRDIHPTSAGQGVCFICTEKQRRQKASVE